MTISRRTFLVSASGAAIASTAPATIGATVALPAPSIASLMRSYLAEYEAIEVWSDSIPTDHRDWNDGQALDHEMDRRIDANNARLRQMIGMPVRTAEDALAALEFLCQQGEYDATVFDLEDYKLSMFEEISWHLLAALRHYTAATAEGRA